MQTNNRRALERVASAPSHPAFEHIDPQTAFLYTPHTVSVLLIGWFIQSHLAGITLDLLDYRVFSQALPSWLSQAGSSTAAAAAAG